MIFDGKSEDFATEMFVTINSTPTRINKSHLVDLYERVSWAAPDRKLAARVVERLYSSGDSPLRYKINRLGGRSKAEKWILQAELFNEIHRWLAADWKKIEKLGAPSRQACSRVGATYMSRILANSAAGGRPASARACRYNATSSFIRGTVSDGAAIQASPCTAARRIAGSLVAPIQIGGRGRWTGRGRMLTLASRKCLPS